MHKRLGSGSFGDVYMGELQQEKEKVTVAIKILRGKMGKQERATFVKEAAIQRRFNHEHVVSLLGVAPNQEPVMVILEFCSGGQLKNYLMKKDPRIVSYGTLIK